nr:hypothetical protein [Tanacetum cinerariifolium]
MTLAASSSTDKSLKSFDELMSTLIDFSAYIMNGLKITNLTQETLLWPAFKLLKGTRSNYAELEYDFDECYKALLEKLDWENPKGGDCPFNLTKPVPLVKTKGAHYDLPVIEDMVLFIWSPIKVALDRYAKWGISHWGAQHKTFYAYAQGLESTHDVYSTKRILAVTRVDIMKKYEAWLFKKRVRDLQLSVKSYQKKINVTKPDIVRPDLQKRHLYTPYQDPQGFIIHHQEYPHEIHAIEKMEFLGKEKSSLHDQENKQAAKGNKDDAELRKIYWSKSKNKGRVPTEMKLVLEQTQQGFSYEVSVSAEGVKELKRKVNIKGEKKEALLTLRQKPSQYICC